MQIGRWDESRGSVVINSSLFQGGIVAVYYLPGTLVGALFGGYIGDRFGRIKTIGIAPGWTIVGATLQCSSQNANWMICVRVFNGIGTGILNAITPVSQQFARTHHFGTSFYSNATSSFIWRFPIAFQILPLLFLLAIVWLMPESPRWLVKVGREEEARYILGRLRGEDGADGAKSEAEFQDIRNICALERKTAKQQNYLYMFFGIGSGKLHTGRRVQLVIWLQIMQEWIGIAGVTIYSPTIFKIAGISSKNQLWVTGLNDIIYMLSTLVCVFTLDRIGRRWTLYWGSVGMGICTFLVGGLSRLGQNAAEGSSTKSSSGIGATFFVFLFTAIFGATWLTVPWLYPAEIFPLEVRAKGNAWGVVGWSIGNEWLGLLCPVMFAHINEKTLYIFGICNVISIPMVYALYPETNQLTLEEMNLVFASDSIWTWDAEREFKLLKEQNPQLMQTRAVRAGSKVDTELGIGGPQRGLSLDVGDIGQSPLNDMELREMKQ
ncbi:hypothetical protein ACLMJK_008211 [Lecanora helva]